MDPRDKLAHSTAALSNIITFVPFFQGKKNLVLLGALLLVVAVVVGRTDFDSVEERLAALE